MKFSHLKYSLLLLTLLSFFKVEAQEITCLDAETSEPLIGVVVAGKFNQSANEFCIFSNTEGKAILPEGKGVIRLIVHHINYESQELLISDKKAIEIKLIPKDIRLDEIVVTGLQQAQSAKQVTYKIKTISSAQIEQMGALSIESVLQNKTNIRFQQDGATGSANIMMQGLSAKYVKILLDGVPMAGGTGTENAIDLNQINVNAIERVEVIEGPMAVSFGADALGGVINIITKKLLQNDLDISVNIQEETVGSEYGIDQGKRSQNARIAYQINDAWSFSTDFSHNQFHGWKGNLPESNRGHDWLPKEQLLGATFLRYHTLKWDAFYRLDFTNETIKSLGEPTQTTDAGVKAFDTYFVTNRVNHQLQGEYRFNKNNRLYSYLAYTDFNRDTDYYAVSGETGAKEKNEKKSEVDWIDAINHKMEYRKSGDFINLMLGYELDYEFGDGSKLEDENSITDLGVYAVTEFQFDRLKLMPALRYIYNDSFDAPLIPQLNLKYDFSKNLSLRVGYGKGFKAPSLKDLYYNFVDDNHAIFGNPNLLPETSDSYNFALTHRHSFKENKHLKLEFSAYYNDLKNVIDYTLKDDNSGDTYLNNFLRKKTTGFNVNASFFTKQLEANVGFGYMGITNELDDENPNNFSFSPELNTNISYLFEKIDLQTSLFYKYTGTTYSPQINSETDEIYMGEMDAYHIVDLTFTKNLPKGFSLSTGVKNLLDTTNVARIGASGAHSGGSSSRIAYGRSYFLKLNYNLGLQLN